MKNLSNTELIQKYKNMPKTYSIKESLARKASKMTREELDKIDMQIKAIDDEIKAVDNEIIKRAKEEGISGTEFYYKYEYEC
jgi:hypothetical protein